MEGWTTRLLLSGPMMWLGRFRFAARLSLWQKNLKVARKRRDLEIEVQRLVNERIKVAHRDKPVLHWVRPPQVDGLRAGLLLCAAQSLRGEVQMP